MTALPLPSAKMTAMPQFRRADPASQIPSENMRWLHDLRAKGETRDRAVARLRGLLLRATRFEVARRRPALPQLGGVELDELAQEAADDATLSVLRRLDDFRGESRFTTWAYKFALLEAAVKVRRRAWRGHEVPVEPETWGSFEDLGAGPEERAERAERALLLAALREGIETALGSPDLSLTLLRLLGPAEPELGCDECFAELDRYVELQLAGAEADQAVPGMHAHLAGCPACAEEHESLRALLELDSIEHGAS